MRLKLISVDISYNSRLEEFFCNTSYQACVTTNNGSYKTGNDGK